MNKLFFLLYFASLSVTFDLNLNVDTLTTTQGIYIKGVGDSFAGNLAVIGDINADGIADFIISAETESSVGAAQTYETTLIFLLLQAYPPTILDSKFSVYREEVLVIR